MSGFFTQIPVFSLLTSLLSQVGLPLQSRPLSTSADVQNLPPAADFAGLIQSMLPTPSPELDTITTDFLPGKSPFIDSLRQLIKQGEVRVTSTLKNQQPGIESSISSWKNSDNSINQTDQDQPTDILIVVPPVPLMVSDSPVEISAESESIPAAILVEKVPTVLPEDSSSKPAQLISSVQVVLTQTSTPQHLKVSIIPQAIPIEGSVSAGWIEEVESVPLSIRTASLQGEVSDPGQRSQHPGLLQPGGIPNSPQTTVESFMDSSSINPIGRTVEFNQAASPLEQLVPSTQSMQPSSSIVSGRILIPLEKMTSSAFKLGACVQFAADLLTDCHAIQPPTQTIPDRQIPLPLVVNIQVSPELVNLVCEQLDQWESIPEIHSTQYQSPRLPQLPSVPLVSEPKPGLNLLLGDIARALQDLNGELTQVKSFHLLQPAMSDLAVNQALFRIPLQESTIKVLGAPGSVISTPSNDRGIGKGGETQPVGYTVLRIYQGDTTTTKTRKLNEKVQVLPQGQTFARLDPVITEGTQSVDQSQVIWSVRADHASVKPAPVFSDGIYKPDEQLHHQDNHRFLQTENPSTQPLNRNDNLRIPVTEDGESKPSIGVVQIDSNQPLDTSGTRKSSPTQPLSGTVQPDFPVKQQTQVEQSVLLKPQVPAAFRTDSAPALESANLRSGMKESVSLQSTATVLLPERPRMVVLHQLPTDNFVVTPENNNQNQVEFRTNPSLRTVHEAPPAGGTSEQPSPEPIVLVGARNEIRHTQLQWSVDQLEIQHFENQLQKQETPPPPKTESVPELNDTKVLDNQNPEPVVKTTAEHKTVLQTTLQSSDLISQPLHQEKAVQDEIPLTTKSVDKNLPSQTDGEFIWQDTLSEQLRQDQPNRSIMPKPVDEPVQFRTTRDTAVARPIACQPDISVSATHGNLVVEKGMQPSQGFDTSLHPMDEMKSGEFIQQAPEQGRPILTTEPRKDLTSTVQSNELLSTRNILPVDNQATQQPLSVLTDVAASEDVNRFLFVKSVVGSPLEKGIPPSAMDSVDHSNPKAIDPPETSTKPGFGKGPNTPIRITEEVPPAHQAGVSSAPSSVVFDTKTTEIPDGFNPVLPQTDENSGAEEVDLLQREIRGDKSSSPEMKSSAAVKPIPALQTGSNGIESPSDPLQLISDLLTQNENSLLETNPDEFRRVVEAEKPEPVILEKGKASTSGMYPNNLPSELNIESQTDSFTDSKPDAHKPVDSVEPAERQLQSSQDPGKKMSVPQLNSGLNYSSSDTLTPFSKQVIETVRLYPVTAQGQPVDISDDQQDFPKVVSSPIKPGSESAILSLDATTVESPDLVLMDNSSSVQGVTQPRTRIAVVNEPINLDQWVDAETDIIVARNNKNHDDLSKINTEAKDLPVSQTDKAKSATIVVSPVTVTPSNLKSGENQNTLLKQTSIQVVGSMPAAGHTPAEPVDKKIGPESKSPGSQKQPDLLTELELTDPEVSPGSEKTIQKQTVNFVDDQTDSHPSNTRSTCETPTINRDRIANQQDDDPGIAAQKKPANEALINTSASPSSFKTRTVQGENTETILAPSVQSAPVSMIGPEDPQPAGRLKSNIITEKETPSLTQNGDEFTSLSSFGKKSFEPASTSPPTSQSHPQAIDNTLTHKTAKQEIPTEVAVNHPVRLSNNDDLLRDIPVNEPPRLVEMDQPQSHQIPRHQMGSVNQNLFDSFENQTHGESLIKQQAANNETTERNQTTITQIDRISTLSIPSNRPDVLNRRILTDPIENDQVTDESTPSVSETSVPQSKKVDGLTTLTTTWKVQESRIIEQVIKASAQSRTQYGSEIRIRLVPDTLGEVHLKVASTAEGLMAEIRATNPMTQDVLQKHAVQIQSMLQDAGFRIDQVVVRSAGSDLHQDYRGNHNQRDTYNSFGQDTREGQSHPDRGPRNPWQQAAANEKDDLLKKWDRYA